MIADLEQLSLFPSMDEVDRAASAAREKELRAVVCVDEDGGVELRYFRGPKDVGGVVIGLTARERERWCHALATPGRGAFLYRENGKWQMADGRSEVAS